MPTDGQSTAANDPARRDGDVSDDPNDFEKFACASGYKGVKCGRVRYNKKEDANRCGKFEAVATSGGYFPAQSHIGSFITPRGAAAAVYVNSLGDPFAFIDVLTELRLRNFGAEADVEEAHTKARKMITYGGR